MEDYIYKIILVGDTNVGKTTFFHKMRLKNYELQPHNATIGVDFLVFHKVLNDINIKINLWDTAGQEKYRSLIKTYFRDASGYILMFDINNYDSFQALVKWYEDIEIMNQCNHVHPVLLLGNKNDLESKINKKEIENFLAYKKNVIYSEISLKEDDKIDIVFNLLLDQITYNLFLKEKKCNGIKIKDKEIKTKSIILEYTNNMKVKKNICCII